MQKLKLFIVGVLFSFAFMTSVYAGVDADYITVMPVYNTSKFFITFDQEIEPQDVVIRIRKENGKIIFSDIMTTDKVTKVYDMEKHGLGIYQVDISGIDFMVTKTVELGKKLGFKAKVIQEKDKVQLMYLSQDADLTIYVKDITGNVLYRAEGKLGKYQQAFDMSLLPVGKYFIKVTNGEQVFEEPFEIE